MEDLIKTLKKRFLENMHRHPDVSFDYVEERIKKNKDKIESLLSMEETGGEPDVISIDSKTKEVIFFDFSKETPIGRRNVCYDKKALDSRKNFKPKDSALEMANRMGLELLTEEEYLLLQQIEDVDLKTSSFLKTSDEIRSLGGSIFGDKRYNRTFIYHNGAESYYSVRGFRCSLRI